MKKKHLLTLVAAGIVATFVFSAYREGPAAYSQYNCSGAETDNGNPAGCSTGGGCHSNSATSGVQVTLVLDSAGKAVTHYIGGKSYNIKITGVNNTTSTLPGWGFQISCITGTAATATPTSAGTFGPSYPTNVHYAAPATYFLTGVVEHGVVLSPTTGSGAKGSTYVETIPWTAPAKGTGTITFFGALNEVNNNGGADAGDLWNTATLTLTEEVPTGINQVTESSDVKAFPNPFTYQTTFTLGTEVNNAGFKLFDMSGRLVKEFNFSGTQVTLDRGTLANGMYFYCIVKNDNSVLSGKLMVQ